MEREKNSNTTEESSASGSSDECCSVCEQPECECSSDSQSSCGSHDCDSNCGCSIGIEKCLDSFPSRIHASRFANTIRQNFPKISHIFEEDDIFFKIACVNLCKAEQLLARIQQCHAAKAKAQWKPTALEAKIIEEVKENPGTFFQCAYNFNYDGILDFFVKDCNKFFAIRPGADPIVNEAKAILSDIVTNYWAFLKANPKEAQYIRDTYVELKIWK